MTVLNTHYLSVSLQGAAGRETWLGVDLLRGGGRTKFTGWIHSGEL